MQPVTRGVFRTPVAAIVAIALGLAVWGFPEILRRARTELDASIARQGSAPRMLLGSINSVANAATRLAPLCAVSLLAVRFRPPRPPIRRLLRAPGIYASAIVTILTTLNIPVLSYRLGWPSQWVSPPGYLISLFLEGTPLLVGPQTIGAVIAAAWITAALGGTWRPEPTWADLAGRAIGFLFIGLVPFRSLVFLAFT